MDPDPWPQLYNKKTLFEHINGQAELYLKYGFRQSVFAIYQNKNKTQNQIEVDIYDMGNVVQAFGVFSRFRNEDHPGGFGLDSFLDDHTALFYKGRYYVMLYAPEKNPRFPEDNLLNLSHPKYQTPPLHPKKLAFSPSMDSSQDLSIFPEGLLGHQFLKSGFQGTYVDGEKEHTLFLAIFKDSQEAEAALKIYHDDLAKKGKSYPEG